MVHGKATCICRFGPIEQAKKSSGGFIISYKNTHSAVKALESNEKRMEGFSFRLSYYASDSNHSSSSSTRTSYVSDRYLLYTLAFCTLLLSHLFPQCIFLAKSQKRSLSVSSINPFVFFSFSQNHCFKSSWLIAEFEWFPNRLICMRLRVFRPQLFKQHKRFCLTLGQLLFHKAGHLDFREFVIENNRILNFWSLILVLKCFWFGRLRTFWFDLVDCESFLLLRYSYSRG